MIVTRRRAAILAASILSAAGLCAAPTHASGSVVDLLGKTAAYQRGCFAPCLCPVLEQGKVRGRFELVPAGFDGLFNLYDVRGVDWKVTTSSTSFRVIGSGTYRIGGEFALQQQLILDLSLDGAAPQHFDSGLVAGGGGFPVIDIAVSLNGMYCFDTAFFVRAHPAIGVKAGASDLSWLPAPPGMSYDVVMGDLGTLARGGGDFSAATLVCLAHAESASSYEIEADPPPGTGYWYLVRAASPGGAGTYDSADTTHPTSRDAGIEASGSDCP